MFKSKSPKACFLTLIITFCLKISGFSLGPCLPPNDCPPTLSTIQGTVQFTPDWHFAWGPNNPQEMSRYNPEGESAAGIYIIGGQGPYAWSVSGAGFSLADDQTQGQSNTLIADITACGSATITVNDSINSPRVEGSVRVKEDSEWVEITPPDCRVPGAPTYVGGLGDFAIRIDGKYRQTQSYTYTWSGNAKIYPESEGCLTEDCGGLCFSPGSNCDPDWGCTQCVKDPRVSNARCNVRVDWPYCLDCNYDQDDGRWSGGMNCRCTVRLQLHEWGCKNK